jgi:hypothetical protein
VKLPDTTYDYRSDNYQSRHQNNSVFMQQYWQVRYRRYVERTLWWPVEHYASEHPMVQLPDPEVAFLRRDSHAIVGTAFRFGPLVRRDSLVRGITLVVAQGPEQLTFPAMIREAHIASAVRLHGAIAAVPALLGIEYLANGMDDAAGRTRFAIAPPPALNTMAAGDRALSDVVLLSPTKSEQTSRRVDSILSNMAPSSVVERSVGTGLYWESYGFKPTDTLTMEIRVKRIDREGVASVVRRFLGRGRGGALAIRWNEYPHSNRMIVQSGDAVPIIGRTIQLRVQSLARGDYQIEVEVRDQAERVATTRRLIAIR